MKSLFCYDERGVEYVWQLQRALYGSPDSGRVWYDTFALYMMEEETVTSFQRCHFEPCVFTHFLDGQVDVNGAPQRIVCVVYVDDGRTWDKCNTVCDGFYTRLQERLSLTFGGGTEFMIGMVGHLSRRGLAEDHLVHLHHEYAPAMA